MPAKLLFPVICCPGSQALLVYHRTKDCYTFLWPLSHETLLRISKHLAKSLSEILNLEFTLEVYCDTVVFKAADEIKTYPKL